MSRHFMPETLLLLRQQGYTARPKVGGGYHIVSPPGGSPEYRSFSIAQPDNASEERVIVNRLRRAGVKFPEDTERSVKPMPLPNPPTLVTVMISPYVPIREKINRVVTLLGEIETDLNRIEADNSKLVQLRELLKGMG